MFRTAFTFSGRALLPLLLVLACTAVQCTTRQPPKTRAARAVTAKPAAPRPPAPAKAAPANPPVAPRPDPRPRLPVPGAAQLENYLPQLRNKRVVLVVNQTSRVGERHLLDTLRARGVNVVRILAPEHGFRGQAAAGAHVADSLDGTTGLPVASLYGATKKPLPRHLADADVVVFDLQDVGARFYTYISTLHYVLEAAAEQHKPVLVLDRPNPNGDYVDGPVLLPAQRSFVGLDPLPIVHGLTLGEAARMMNGEKWLAGGVQAALTVIPVQFYQHGTPYELPVRPSPNLPNAQAVRLYPSLALFEGTSVSLGRGTDLPFQQLGHPAYPDHGYSFTPAPQPSNPKPPLMGQTCYGVRLDTLQPPPRFTLRWVMDFYQQLPDKSRFFNSFFDKLAGTPELRKQIEAGQTEAEIRASWEPELAAYRAKRAKYMLYK